MQDEAWAIVSMLFPGATQATKAEIAKLDAYNEMRNAIRKFYLTAQEGFGDLPYMRSKYR